MISNLLCNRDLNYDDWFEVASSMWPEDVKSDSGPRILVTGLSGSGKSTIAREVGGIDLDNYGYWTSYNAEWRISLYPLVWRFATSEVFPFVACGVCDNIYEVMSLPWDKMYVMVPSLEELQRRDRGYYLSHPDQYADDADRMLRLPEVWAHPHTSVEFLRENLVLRELQLLNRDDSEEPHNDPTVLELRSEISNFVPSTTKLAHHTDDPELLALFLHGESFRLLEAVNGLSHGDEVEAKEARRLTEDEVADVTYYLFRLCAALAIDPSRVIRLKLKSDKS